TYRQGERILRRVPIRLKLIGALVIPMVALAFVTTFEVVGTSRDATRVREQADLAKATIAPGQLLSAIQAERAWAVLELGGHEGLLESSETFAAKGYDETRQSTDDAISQLRADVLATGGAVAEAYEPAIDGLLEELPQIRADIDAQREAGKGGQLFGAAISERYAAQLEPVLDAASGLAPTIDDDELRQGVEVADALARQNETMAQLLLGVVSDFLGDQKMEPGHLPTIAARVDAFQRNAALMTSAPGPYAEIADL